ncbi:MAG: hypothetical protein ABR924_14655 [Terracidiphilus sp.]|jgi:hypothetical protein
MAEQKRFERLKEGDPLVEELASGKYPWWNTIVALSHTDKDINIQVRGSYLNVYFKMGNLLKVGMDGRKVICQTHYKYLVGALDDVYVDLKTESDHLSVKGPCPLVTSLLEGKNFRLVKQNISTYAGEEKQIQSRLVEKNKDTLLDAEISFSDYEDLTNTEDGNTRIDLANCDKNRDVLVFVELKQIFDTRLYSGEINKQIAKYVAFAEKHQEHLVEAYNNVIQVKRALNVISEVSYLASVNIQEVEPRPILVIAGYDQDIINAKKQKIIDNLETSNLSGLYFFGTDVDLNFKSGKNKDIFI